MDVGHRRVEAEPGASEAVLHERAREGAGPPRARPGRPPGPPARATRTRSGRTQTVSLAPPRSQPWRRARTRASPARATSPSPSTASTTRLHQVGVPDEAGDEAGGRTLVDLERGADLLQPSARHHPDAVAHGQRLALVVGDVDEGRAQAPLEPLQLLLELEAELQVEGGQRLVEEEDAWLVDEGAREGDPLLLAAGQLGRCAGLRASPAPPARAPRRRGVRPRRAGRRRIRSPKATLSSTE